VRKPIIWTAVVLLVSAGALAQSPQPNWSPILAWSGQRKPQIDLAFLGSPKIFDQHAASDSFEKFVEFIGGVEVGFQFA
jgi:hypothetical protein